MRLEDVGNAPLQFQKSDYRDGYRRSVHHPHTIYYRIVDSEMVEIVRVLRGQDPRCAFQRSWAVIPRDRGQRFRGIVGTHSMNLGR